MFTVRDAVRNSTGAPVTLSPYGLVSRTGTPQVSGYYILHEGPVGYLGGVVARAQLQLAHAGRAAGLYVNRRLARLYRQILAYRSGPAAGRRGQGAIHAHASRTGSIATRPIISRPPVTVPAEGTAAIGGRGFSLAPRKSICSMPMPRRAFRISTCAIDFGWFYFLTKPIFLTLQWFYRAARQFRPGDPAADPVHQAAVLPARQQILSGDEQDEAAAAGDAENARALPGRQGAPAAGDDGDVQAGRRQPGGRLPADRHPDPGVFLALQGAVRHDRDAARAVFRLDPRSVGAGPDHGFQPVRPDSLSRRRIS